MRCWIGLVVAAAFVAWPFRVHAQGDQEGAVELASNDLDSTNARWGMEWSSEIVENQPPIRRAQAGFIASATVLAAGGLLVAISYIEPPLDNFCVFPPCEPPDYAWHAPLRTAGIAVMVSGAAATIATGALWGRRLRKSYRETEALYGTARRARWDPTRLRLVF